MASYDPNPIEKMLQGYPRYYGLDDQDGANGAWSAFKLDYVRKQPAERVVDIMATSAWLEEERNYVSKESAEILHAKRELVDLDAALRRAGR